MFGFSRSLCSCGSFLLPCSHGFRRSFSQPRKGGPMFHCPLERTKRRVPMSGNGLAAILLCMPGVSQVVSLEALRQEKCGRNGCFARFVGCKRCSFGRRCAVRVAAAGNCAQGISQLASVAGRSPQKEKGSLIRLPLLLTTCSFDPTRKPN